MYGDFSRWTFDAARRYRRVLQQQGRVLTDADWNELNAILAEETRLLAADLIGPHGGPKDNCAFFMSARPADLPSEHPNKAAFTALKEKETEDDNLFLGSGHYWVNGLLCAVDASFSYRHQPYFLLEAGNDDLEFLSSTRADIHLAYLEVWERHLTENDEPLMTDPALTETCSRSQLVWQVKVAQIAAEGEIDAASDEGRRAAYQKAEDFLDATQRRTNSLPLMKAQVGEGASVNDPCILPADASYRGRENQLYRVEIHQGGSDLKKVSWKWSRDNGSVTFPIVLLTGTSAVVSHLGHDSMSTLNDGDWVEILDDRAVLHNEPGTLARVTGVERDEFLVSLKFSENESAEFAENAPTHPFLRRWDHKGTIGALPVLDALGEKNGKLESGIEIQFTVAQNAPGTTFRTGDYWLIPARTATGTILWPEDRSLMPPKNKLLPPQGVTRHYAPLALLQSGKVTDIRFQFAPLAQLIAPSE